MTKNRKQLQTELQAIQHELKNAFQPTINRTKLQDCAIKIASLLSDAAVYMNKENLLSPWAKDHIVCGINSLYWNWLYSAANALSLSFTDPADISPDIKYRKEITDLTIEDIKNQINSLKKHLEEIDTHP